MVFERSLVFIKWPSVEKKYEIFDFLDYSLVKDIPHFQRTIEKEFIVSQQVIAEHYAHVRTLSSNAYEDYMATFQKYPLCVRVYLGETGMCNAIRKIVGATDPAKANEGTIRRTFSRDSLERAIAEKRAVRNVMHASGSSEEAEVEIARFTPPLGELKYFPFPIS